MANDDFKVRTVGYYKRDNAMSITANVRPTKLNANYHRFPAAIGAEWKRFKKDHCIDLTTHAVLDDGNLENYFESLLNYIAEVGFHGEPPQYVTNKYLLHGIAADSLKETLLLLVRYKDVIFISTCKDFKNPAAHGAMKYLHGANFQHYLTKVSEQETPHDYSSTGCKAVLKFGMNLDGKKATVFYSGEIDTIDDRNRHIELKAKFNGTNGFYFWIGIQPTYWQMFFSDCHALLVGDKTGAKQQRGDTVYWDTESKSYRKAGTKERIDRRTYPECYPFLDYPAYSLCDITKLLLSDIPRECALARQKSDKKLAEIRASRRVVKDVPFLEWSHDEGKQRVQDFLAMVKRSCPNNGESVVIAKTVNVAWELKEIPDLKEQYELKQFGDLVIKKMDEWETKKTIV